MEHLEWIFLKAEFLGGLTRVVGEFELPAAHVIALQVSSTSGKKPSPA